MMRATMENVFSEDAIDELFVQTAQRQREATYCSLPWSTCFRWW
jgi:hypothetical protein